MKKQLFFAVLGVMLLLIPGALWAGNQPGVSQDTPAILVSLGQANAIPLDDVAAAAVRGQAPQYVLVKVFGLNMFDGGAGVQWTWNPLGYRYGNWGGPGYSGGSSGTDPSVADTMDGYFKAHDLVYSTNTTAAQRLDADKWLLAALDGLPKISVKYWGDVYVANPTGLTTANVSVFGISLIGGKVFGGWKDMPYTEYSRREAMYGVQLMILGKSVLRIN